MSVNPKQYVTIDNFSPGIYSAGSWPIYGTFTAAGPIMGAPVGSAQEVGTFKCVPTPDGKGLQPAPVGFGVTYEDDKTPASFTTGKIIGVSSRPASSEDDDYTLPLVMVALSHSGGPLTTFYILENAFSGDTFQAFTLGSIVGSTAGVCSGAITKLSLSATSPYLTAGEFVIAATFCTLSGNGETHIIPDPSTPTVLSSQQVIAEPARILGYQNRLIYLTKSYGGDSGPVWNGSTMTFYTRLKSLWDRINFTDPVNSDVVPTLQEQIFDPENRAGFGAFGPLNANTLLLVKADQGGVVVQGDIANPIVTSAPAIQGTGGLNVQSDFCELGMVYVSHMNGAWAWSGGANSQKISTQLRDDFFYCSVGQLSPSSIIDSAAFPPGWSVSCRKWADYLVVTNGYLYDLQTNSWWRLEDPDFAELMYFEPSGSNKYLWGTLTTVDFSATPEILWGIRYERHSFSEDWSWNSNPIPISSSPNQMAKVDEIIIEAQGIEGSTFVITARGFDGNTDGTTGTVTAPVTVTLPAEAENQPVKIRIPYSIECYNAIIKIVADSNTSLEAAPTLRAIHFGLDTGNLVAVQ